MSTHKNLVEANSSQANSPVSSLLPSAANDGTYPAGKVVHAEQAFGGKNDGLKDDAQAPTQDFDNGPVARELREELSREGIDPNGLAAQEIVDQAKFEHGGAVTGKIASGQAQNMARATLDNIIANPNITGTGSPETQVALETLQRQRGVSNLGFADRREANDSFAQGGQSQRGRRRLDQPLKRTRVADTGAGADSQTGYSVAANERTIKMAQPVSRLDSSSQPA